MKKIVALYGGPGSGKSTTCAGLFYKLKLLGFNSEMNREYVKDLVWEKRSIQKGDQPYFFSKMARKERIYMNAGLDFIITDSPLVLTHFYGLKYDETEQKYNTSLMMLKNHHKICQDLGYKVDHFYLNRTKSYEPKGRMQDEAGAIEIDVEIKSMLNTLGIKFKEIDGNNFAVDNILKELLGTTVVSNYSQFNTIGSIYLTFGMRYGITIS